MGNATGISWKRILAEFLAIFAGVFLGLFADQWWQERHERQQERVVLMDMLQELEEEAADMRSVLRRARAWSEAGLWMTQNIGADIVGDSAWSALSPLFFRSSYAPRSAAYVSLRDSGQLDLIADQALRQQVAAYFETAQQDTYTHHLRTLAVYDEFIRVAREHFAWRLPDDATTLVDPAAQYVPVRPWSTTSQNRVLTGAMLHVALHGDAFATKLDRRLEENASLREYIEQRVGVR